MARAIYGKLFVMMVAALLSQNINLSKSTAVPAMEPDGTYEFISENTVLARPSKGESARSAPQWIGLWQFHSGYYSQILMKQERKKFFNSNKVEDLEFEASGGSYKVKSNSIVFTENYTLHPFDVGRSHVAMFRIQGNTLTLVERLQPGVEDSRDGTVTTTLQRVNN